jgi:hypothetical protein
LAILLLDTGAVNFFGWGENDGGGNQPNLEEGGSGAIEPAMTVDDPLLRQTTTTVAEWITPE